MLTRAFLLLLAMMTGLSAAQAGGLSRPAAEQMAVSKSVAQMAQGSAALCAAKVAHVLPMAGWDEPKRFAASSHAAHLPAPAPLACIYRSERRRE